MQDSTRNELRRLLLFGAAVLVLVFIARVYRPALDAAFIWDDHVLLADEASYRHASVGQIMTHAFWPDSPYADTRPPYYRPLVLLSFQIDFACGGTPFEYHFTNLLLHLTACGMLAIVIRRSGASYPSAILAMLLWGVLPRLTEAVVWIAGRTDVLAGLFGLAALAVWPETSLGARQRALWPRSLAGGLLLFASCASKEVGVAFAFAMAVTLVRRREAYLRGAISIAAPLILYFALRTAAFANTERAAHRDLGAWRRTATVFEAIGRYGMMIADPFHSRTSIGMLGEVDSCYVSVGIILGLLVLAIAYHLVKHGSFGARLGALLAVAAFFPVLHILPLTLAGSVTADRLLYVPLAGLTIAITTTIPRATRFSGAAIVALAFALSGALHERAKDYREEIGFWTVAGEHAHPHNTLPRMSLASLLLDAIEAEPACKLYEKSVDILARSERAGLAAHRRAREGLTTCWPRLGRYDDTLRLAEELARSYPNSARIQLALEHAHLHVREFDAAIVDARRLSTMNAAFAKRYGLPPETIAKIRDDEMRFTELDPQAKANHLAALGRAPEAVDAFRALAMDDELRRNVRSDGVTFLVFEGPFEDARRARETVPPPPHGWPTNEDIMFERRQSVHEAYLRLRERVDALAR